MSGGRAWLPRVPLGLVPDEFDQALRLQAFRVAHPEVVIGDGGFGTFQARILEPDGETVITRYRLAELLDKLDELTGERRARPDVIRAEKTRPGPGCRQSAASQSASRSITRSRICGDGVISGLGGCKMASLDGPVQGGKAWPRSP